MKKIKNKLLLIFLQSALWGYSKGEYAVYSANNSMNLLRTIFFMSFYFIVLKLLLLGEIHLHKYIVYGIGGMILILCQFSNKEDEKLLFDELHKIKARDKINSLSALLGLLILVISLLLFFVLAIYTVSGYTQ